MSDSSAPLRERLEKNRNKPRQKRAERTRQAILEAARDTFNTDAYEHATIKGVAALAGVSVGAIYEHFSDKRSILMEVGLLEAARIREDSFTPFSEAAIDAGDETDRRLLQDLVRVAIRATVDSRKAYPRLHATLVDIASRDVEFGAVLHDIEEDAILFIQGLLITFSVREPGDAARRCARVLYRVISDTVQHVVLHNYAATQHEGQWPPSLDEETLVAELTLVVMGYLLVPELHTGS